MSQVAAPQMTFASGRYSKRKRTQVNYRMEEMDVDEVDSESEEEMVKPKKQRKTAASGPLPKQKIFPFLQLPAEIRNMIYEYALTDPSGINFVAVQRHKRRCVERVSIDSLRHALRSGYCYQPNNINDTADDRPNSLVPSLLAVNKQIHQEGCNILYSNELVFADTVALYSFMINLGPTSASQIKTIRLKGWGWGRTSKAYNNSCFAVLIWASNLEKFYIDTSVGWYRRSKNAAQQIYRDAFPWLEAVGHAKGKFDAALDILDLVATSINGYYSQPNGEKCEEFDRELRGLLGLQQKRVMSKLKTKKKVSKISNES